MGADSVSWSVSTLQLHKGIKHNENDMDMDKEDYMDWFGLTSVFTMDSKAVGKRRPPSFSLPTCHLPV